MTSDGSSDARGPELATAIAVWSTLGTLELAFRAYSMRPPGRELLLALAFTIVAYGILGSCLFLIGLRVGILRRALLAHPASFLGFYVGAWAAVVACGLLGQSDDSAPRMAFTMVSALALGWAVFTVTRGLASRLSWATRPAPWALPALTGLVVCAGFFLASRAPAAAASKPSGGTPSVLLVTIDTLRADRVGAYGYAAAHTPTFDGLASHGYVFEQAITPSIITGPSHTSILSGKVLATHGITENSQRIPSGLQTLAELMSMRGFETAAFVSGEPLSTAASGIPARFAHHSQDFRAFRGLPDVAYRTVVGATLESVLDRPDRPFRPYSRPADDVTRDAVAWLRQPSTSPFFAWVHYYDPHLPYEPPSRLLPPDVLNYDGRAVGDWYNAKPRQRAAMIASPSAMKHMMRLYDAEVSFVDEQLAVLVEAARAHAGSAGLWIVITSDHGESFGEHGIYFWRDLYDDTLRVPLAIVPPKQLPQAVWVKPQVRLIDLAPTLCEFAGVAAPGDMDGLSLTPLMNGQQDSARPASSRIVPSRTHQYDRLHLSVRTDRWKAILRAPGWGTGRDHLWMGQTRELYDLASDPLELRNVADTQKPGVWAALETAAAHEASAAVQQELTPEQREMLRSLGYVR